MTVEVSERAEKIKHPELYDGGWSEKTEKEKNGLIILRNGKRI